MSEEKRMGGLYRYMTDDELETLIAEVEDHGMLAPPVYLKELMMEEAGKTAGTARKSGIDPKTARMRLMVYSLKVIGAAAAAIFCLTMVPMDTDGMMEEAGNRRRERVIEEDMERYREENERIRNDSAGGEDGFSNLLESVLGEENVGTAASVWDGITGWFGNGGKGL